MCIIELLENCQPGEIKYSSPDDLLRLLSYMYRSDKTFSDSVRKKNTAYDGPYCGCEPFFFPREYETDPVMVCEVSGKEMLCAPPTAVTGAVGRDATERGYAFPCGGIKKAAAEAAAQGVCYVARISCTDMSLH